MRIYIIRHGETQSNTEARLQGQVDNPLNASGIELAEVTGLALKGIRFDAAFTSPLSRAYQTGELVLRESGNADVPLREDRRIMEISVGDWEDRRIDDCPSEAVRAYFHNPLLAPGFPNGENVHQVCERTQAFLRELARMPYENVLVSTHGCAMRAMLNFLYEDPSDFWHGKVPLNCAVNIVEVTDGKMVLAEEDRIYYDPAKCVNRYSMV